MTTLDELLIKVSADTAPAEKDVKGLAGFVDKHFAKIAAASVAAGAVMLKGLNDGLNIEAGADKLAAQLDLTAEQSARVGGIAGDLYAGAWGDSLEHVNTAVGAVMSSIDGMATASDSALHDLTASALDFATAFDTDVTRAVSVAGTVMKSGLAKDGTEAFDLLTQASQKVPAALREDLLDAGEEYSQFFAALGFSGAQAFNLLVESSKDGMYGIDKAGDAIKEFTIRATDMSALSGTAFEAIGLDMDEMATALLAGGDSANQAFFKIVEGLQGIEDPTEQAAAAIALFGTPLEDLGVTEIPAFLDSLAQGAEGFGEFEGAAADMGATLNENAKTNLTAFKRGMEQNVAGALLPVIGLLTALPGPAETAISTLMGFAALAAPIGPFLLAITTMLPMLKSWELLTKLQAAAQWVLNGSMFASPVFWLIAALLILIGIGYLLIKNWDTIRNAFVGAWNTIWALGKAFIAWYLGMWVSAFNTVRDKIGAALTWIRNAWNSVWAAVRGAGESFMGWLRGIPGAIGRAFGSLASIITAPFRSAFNGIARLWNGTVGRLAFSVPAWIPMIGGRSFSVPKIPMLAQGGLIAGAGSAWVGEHGPERVDLPRGARVTPLGAGDSAMARVELVLRGDEDLVNLMRKSIRSRGGNVQVVLGTSG